jgi:hypothetical protein
VTGLTKFRHADDDRQRGALADAGDAQRITGRGYTETRMSPAGRAKRGPVGSSGPRSPPVEKKFETRLTGPVNHGVLFKVNCFA